MYWTVMQERARFRGQLLPRQTSQMGIRNKAGDFPALLRIMHSEQSLKSADLCPARYKYTDFFLLLFEQTCPFQLFVIENT